MRDGSETKEKIARAALRLFFRKGVDGASMRDVVHEAGVSLGAFYNHYRSKEELASTLFSEGWSGLATEMRRRVRAEEGLRNQLRAIVGYVFSFSDEDPEQVGYLFFSRHLHVRQINVRLPNPYLVTRLLITNAISRGEAKKMDIQVATQIVMGVVIQMVDAKILGLLKGPLEARAQEVADALYDCLKA